MEENLINLSDRIFSDNYDSLLQIVKQLNQLMEKSEENDSSKILDDSIVKFNNIINNNKKNLDLMRKDINELFNKSDKSAQSIINDKEIKDDNGEYKGQIVNGLKNGKGIYHYNNGD